MTQLSSSASAAVRRWQIAETLRQLREDAGLTHDETIAKLHKGPGTWSRPKLSRIENREQPVKSREMEQLLDLYGVTDQKLRQWLIDLAGMPHERGWFTDIRKHMPEQFHRFLDWEVALVASSQFETLLVPGLLQTAEYARALISSIEQGLIEEEVERRVMARMARQQILTRQNPPQLHVILDAGLLERPVGTGHVMRNQLRRLIETTEAPHITIQILPKSAGAGPALEGPFSVNTLPEPIPDFGYAEGPAHTAYIDNRDEVRALTLRFGILTEQAMSHAESVQLLTEAAHGYE